MIAAATFETPDQNISGSDFDTLTDDELLRLIEDTKTKNEQLSDENSLLGRFLAEVEEQVGPLEPAVDQTSSTESSQSSQQSLDDSTNLVDSSVAKEGIFGTRRSRRKLDSYLPLSIPHKCYIATKRLAEMLDILNRIQLSRKFDTNDFQARSEEARQEKEELERDLSLFNEEIRVGAKHPVTNRILAEKVVNYFKDSITNKAIFAEQCKMKTLENKAKRKKMQEYIHSRIEASKELHEVDIVKAQLQHLDSVERLRKSEKMHYSVRAKLNKLQRDASELKKTLGKNEKELKLLTEEITAKEKAKEVFDTSKSMIEKEKQECSMLREKIMHHPRRGSLPEIMDCVQLEVKLAKLQNDVKIRTKKIETAKMLKLCQDKSDY